MLIVFDGLDKAGKSTHIKETAKWLKESGKSVLLTREPGGSELGEKLREIFLNSKLDPMTQLFLISAARIEHCNKLKNAPEKIILCDRFIDSTYAYQGLKIKEETIEQILNLSVTIWPDFTFLFLNKYAKSEDLMDKHADDNREAMINIFNNLAKKNQNKYMIIPDASFEKQQEMIKAKLKEIL